MSFEERTMKSEKIYDGKILNLRIDTVELADKKYSKREIVEKPGAVAIIALDEDDRLILVKQFRKPIESCTIELPAGKIDLNESPKDAAFREFREETGYEAKNMNYILEFYSSVGFSDEIIYVFYANDIKNVSQDLGEDNEYIELIRVDWDEALKMIVKGEILDSKTILGILYADKYIRKA